MKRMMQLVLTCGWCGLTGYGATNYVDRSTGNDAFDGTTPTTAKRTIQAAVDAARAGDTVLVAPGVYDEGMAVTPGGWLRNRVVVTKDITLQSRDSAATTVILGARDPADATYEGCGSNAVRCVFMDRGTLKGFTLTGGATGSQNKEDLNNRGGGLYSPNTSGLPIVAACIVSNNAAIRGGGAYGGAFHRCRITHNRAQANGAGVRDSKLQECLVVFNDGSGAAFCYARPGGRVNGLFNCTVAYNTGPGLDQSSAYNTISVGNEAAFRSSMPEITFVNCCLSSPTVLGSNNIVAAYARFVDAAGGDFRLLENSPCLDAGSAAFLSGATEPAGYTDFLGAPRVQGKGLDIGAVEGVVAGIAAVAIDPPQGAGALSPSSTLILKTLPTQVVFTAFADAGSALQHFTLDGEVCKKRRNLFTLPVTRPGGYSVSAVFQKALPWDPRLTEADVVAEPEAADAVEGRLEHQAALRIEEGALAWACRDLGPDYFIEFWFSPLAWRAIGNDSVELCRLSVGPKTYVLSKAANKSNLTFGADSETAAIYPVYAWDDAEWAQALSRKTTMQRSVGWHHVSLAVAGQRLRLTIDGFPAREIHPIEVKGPLKQLALSGNPGTAFTLPLLGRGGTLDPTALRRRYLALFLNETQIRAHLLTAARMKTPPKVDGHVSANEWNDATRITGWVTPATGRLLPQEFNGYLGYDDERLYLAVLAPAVGNGTGAATGAAGNAAGFDLFLGPPFISGEEPRRLLQFTGTPTGNKTQRQVLPVRDDQWRGAWNWTTAIVNGQRISEFSARFEEIDLPKPAPGETWSINLVDRQANAGWAPTAGVETNVVATAELQFDPKMPVVQTGTWTMKDGRVSVAVGIYGLKKQHRLVVGMQLYGGNDFLPTETEEKQVVWEGKNEVTVNMGVATGIHPYGRVAVYVKDGKKDVYYHSVGFPIAKEGDLK